MRPYRKETVVGDDHAGAGADGGGQDVAVVRVGQGLGLGRVFLARHEAVTDGLVHQGPRSRQPLGRQAWVVLEDASDSLVVDPLRPPDPHHPRLSAGPIRRPIPLHPVDHYGQRRASPERTTVPAV